MDKDKMSVDERFKYLRLMHERYDRAPSRQAKQELLDEMQEVTRLSRKHLIYRMNHPGPARQARSRERERVYDQPVEGAVRLIADALDWICAQRLLPVLVSTAQHLARFGELELSDEVQDKLAQISLATLTRMLKRLHPQGGRVSQWRRGRHPQTSVQARVPIHIIPWQESEPGHFEIDLVHHGVEQQDGHLCTLQALDVCTGWSECVALAHYDFGHVWQGLMRLRERCPLPIVEMHSDNGSEFLNQALQTQFGQYLPGALFSRGRPGHKNDSRFVEQSNGSLIRAYLGDLPLHTYAQCQALNALYEDLWLYHNYFQPVLRQIHRQAIIQPNGVCFIRRQQDEAKTPLTRLLQAHPPLSRGVAEVLCQRRDQTNLRELKDRIEQHLEGLRDSVLREAAYTR
jgi:hypothetical protein